MISTIFLTIALFDVTTSANEWYYFIGAAGTNNAIRCNPNNLDEIQCASDNVSNCRWGSYSAQTPYTVIPNVVSTNPLTIACPGWNRGDGIDACAELNCYSVTTMQPNAGDCSVLAIDEFLLQCSTEFPAQQTAISDLDAATTQLETDVTINVTQNANDITQLQTDLNNGITGATTQITTLQHGIDDVNLRIDDLNNGITGATTQITTLQHGIDDLNNDITGATTQITTLQHGIDDVTLRIDDLNNCITGATTQITTLQQGIDDLNNGITGATTQITTLQQGIDDVAGMIDSSHSDNFNISSSFNLKDLAIVVLLSINLLAMFYFGFCKNGNNKKQDFVKYDEGSGVEQVHLVQ